MEKINIKKILSFLVDEYSISGDKENLNIQNTMPLGEENENSLIWISPGHKEKKTILERTPAPVIICEKSLDLPEKMKHSKCLIRVENPRLVYSRLTKALFKKPIKYSIHETAIIHPEALICDQVYIGPYTYIGKCTINNGAIIHGNCYLYDNTRLGKNVVVEAGCVLGAEGFGLVQNPSGEWEKIYHLGGLNIEDNVEIGATTTIDRGTIGDTIIRKGVKVSKAVHISHNVEIGQNTLVTGGVLISGSTKIGKNVWIGPKASLLNKINIQDNAFIGISAVVTKDIPSYHRAIGNRVLPPENK